MFSRFDTIPACDEQTDGRTSCDGNSSRLCIALRSKKYLNIGQEAEFIDFSRTYFQHMATRLSVSLRRWWRLLTRVELFHNIALTPLAIFFTVLCSLAFWLGCEENRGKLFFQPFSLQRDIQEAQLSQRDRGTLRVIEYFAKSFKLTQDHSKWRRWVRRKSLLVFHCNNVCISCRFWAIQRQKNSVTLKLG